MTHTTLQEARETADHLEAMPRLYAGAACNALRSLADQLESVTAERDKYKQDALRYRFVKSGVMSLDHIRKTFNDSSSGTDKSIDDAIAYSTRVDVPVRVPTVQLSKPMTDSELWQSDPDNPKNY